MKIINPALIYLASSLLLYFGKAKWRKVIALLTSLITALFILDLAPGQILRLPFLDFELILLDVTKVNKFIGIIFIIFNAATIIYGINLFRRKDYWLSYFYIGASLGIIFVGDFFSFYICWELMTVSSYFLIFNNNKPVTRQTSYYYFMMHLVGAISLLWGILLHYNAVGSMVLTRVEVGLPFFILAVGIKLAFIGLHTWLPKTYAQTPFYISVLLSAYTTKVGVYACYKLLPPLDYLAYAGVVSALLGVVFALLQTEIRQILSYHIISQIGYMIASLEFSAHRLSQLGGFAHLGNHIFYKGLLYMVAGVIIYTTGKEDLGDLGGLSKKLPYTTIFAVIAAASIAGIPFFNGYTSKLLIKKATAGPIMKWGLYIAGIGTSLSFLKILYFTFFSPEPKELSLEEKPSLNMLSGMGILAVLSIIIGLRPQWLLTLLGGVKKEIDYFSVHYLWSGLEPTIVALILFKVAYQWIKPQEHKKYGVDLYLYLGRALHYLSSQLSYFHNGDLQRYLLWILTALVILWSQVLI